MTSITHKSHAPLKITAATRMWIFLLFLWQQHSRKRRKHTQKSNLFGKMEEEEEGKEGAICFRRRGENKIRLGRKDGGGGTRVGGRRKENGARIQIF